MSRVDELVAQLAPDGIEVKSLGEIGELVRGNGMPKTELTNAGVGAIHYGQIYTRYGVWTTTTDSFVTAESAAKLAKANPGDIIITNTSENLEDVGKAVAWLGDEQIVTGGHATVIRHRQDPKFLSYWFQSESFAKQKRALATGTKVIDVSARQLQKIRIPVPPLRVQREIVRILDRFTELDGELKAELEARRVQYEYLRQDLVSTETAAVERVQLGDIAEVRVGQAPPSGVPLKAGTYPYVNAGTTPSGWSDYMNTAGGAITIPSRGQGGVGVIGYQFNDFWCGPLCYRIRSKRDDLSDRFLYHYLKFIQPDIRGLQQTGGTPALNRKELVLVKVPVPSKHAQERVTLVLDKLDMLINDSTTGLPAELAARRKQYVHYRDKLLTFEERSA